MLCEGPLRDAGNAPPVHPSATGDRRRAQADWCGRDAFPSRLGRAVPDCWHRRLNGRSMQRRLGPVRACRTGKLPATLVGQGGEAALHARCRDRMMEERHRRAAHRPVRHLGQPDQFGSPRPWPAEPARHRLADPGRPLGRRLQPAVTGRAGRAGATGPRSPHQPTPARRKRAVIATTTARRILRVGSYAGIAGALLGLVGNLLHPATPIGDPEASPHDRRQPALGPRSPGHRPRLILMLGGLVAIAHSIQDGLAAPWPGWGPSPPSPASPSG
jgi:hypothetical protein